MEVLSIRNYPGRNIFSHQPVIKMIVDLGELADVPTNYIVGFNDRLLNLFPGLISHSCSPGYPGGFVERLHEGTLASHVTEHLALELQSMLGYDVHFGKTRVIEDPNIYYIIYEYINEKCAIDIGYVAAEIVLALASNEEVRIDYILDQLSEVADQFDLGPSTQAIVNEARFRNIPVRRFGDDSLLQLGYGSNIKYIEASLPGSTSCIAVDLAKNKQLAKELLRQQSIPVPTGGIVYSEKAAIVLAEQIGYPVAVKPLDANQGKGVTVNIYNEHLLLKAYDLANSFTRGVLVEKYIKGKDYRILVVGDKVVAVAERKPPMVIGDGVSSIAELVDQENINPLRGIGHERPLTKICLDEVSQEYLARLELRVDDIPSPGQIVYIRENGNLSTGGSARDCTNEIHPRNKEMAVRAAKAIGLDVAGIDVIAENISRLITAQNGALIEVNAAPGLRMHLSPTEGEPRNVAADIVEHLFPTGERCSIPIVSITGTNGKTTVTRLIHHVLSLSGCNVGMTCSSGTYIRDECIAIGDNTGPVSAQSILFNREVETAVLETARGGIIRGGLGYDLADVGVITNISDDHLGVDGVNTLEDMAFIKTLVIEAIKPNGYAVLNADDPATVRMIAKVRCNLVLFSCKPGNPMINQHINQGGTALLLENGLICLYNQKERTEIIEVDDIPITFNGQALCNIENSLAAAASLLALGLSTRAVKLGFVSFRPDPQSNAGRFNLFEVGNFQVLLDYGHNPSGYKSVIQFIQTFNAPRLVGVIGMPGDRTNRAIKQVGQLCGSIFDKLYIKEDKDLRGRDSGEVAGLLTAGAINGGASPTNIEIILSETQALQTALANAMAGDLIVMFYEKFEENHYIIQEHIEKLPVIDSEQDILVQLDRLPSDEFNGQQLVRAVIH